MTRIPIRTTADTDIASAIAVMVLAFAQDPIIRWIYPDPYDYLAYFPDFAGIFAHKAAAQASVCQLKIRIEDSPNTTQENTYETRSFFTRE